MTVFLLSFLQVQYSGGSCSDTNTGYFIGFSAVFFFVCAISVAQLVIIISVQNNKKSKVMKIRSVILPQQRKQPTFCDATSGFPMKICLRNGCRNSVLMSLHHSDLGRASDWLKQIYNAQAFWQGARVRDRTIRSNTHNRQNPAQYWKISWKFKLNQVFLLISKISRKLLGYLPSKTNEKSIAFSSNSSGAYKNNKALSIARAVLGTSHVHIEYCVVMQRSVGYWGSSYPICGNCFTNNKSELFTGIW